MSIEFNLLKDLTEAIDADRTAYDNAANACRATWATSIAELPPLVAARDTADAVASHARHELAAALAAARMHVTTHQ